MIEACKPVCGSLQSGVRVVHELTQGGTLQRVITDRLIPLTCRKLADNYYDAPCYRSDYFILVPLVGLPATLAVIVD